ncbi:MAG: PHP domain-containing protein [Oscillospiraceae bacterium]
MFIDLHVHERAFSLDTKMTLAELVQRAREMGMGAVCVTDHDSLGIQEEAARYAKQVNFPIFVGVEVLTRQGDMIAFGSPYAFAPRTLDAQEFIHYVHAGGGACFCAHPFRDNGRGVGEHLEQLRMLDGVEVLNGSTSLEENRKALEYAKRLGLQPLGVSDAHDPAQLGKYVTWLPEEPFDLQSLIRILRSGECRPAIWEDGAFRIVDTF